MKKIHNRINKNKSYKTIFIIASSVIISIGIILVFNYINKKNIENIFNKYELSITETTALYETEKEMKVYTTISVICVWTLTIIVVLLNYISSKSMKTKIKKTLANIENIINNNYEIQIDEIKDDEFGVFENQIYQIVDKLKEYSNTTNKDREKLSKYLEDISHQIRTPLMTMTVMTDNMLDNNNNLDENTYKYICNISKQLSQINWLIDNLLKMARLDTKSVNFKKEEINVDKLVREAIKNIEILLDIYEQKIIIKGEENLKFIGDFKWHVEAITNILKNAVEHSKKGEEIKIEYKENALFLEIIIEDKGSGISEKDLAHIFDRFYKGDNSNKESFGIGLSLAKEIIEYQNGEITVNSKLNEGTRFIIKYFKT